MSTLRKIIKRLVPESLLRARRRWINDRQERRLSGLSAAEAFGEIYSSGGWGGGSGDDFFSGPGSHDPEVVGPYVAAIRSFAEQAPSRLDAVDLGCGDFNVGAQLRSAFGAYRAFDVVPALIERNQARYADLDVAFGCIDIAEDPLPAGDVVMIRQVLQHLSNEQIAKVVPKLRRYRYAIISEHLPAAAAFTPNIDKPMSGGTRLDREQIGRGEGSGVVLTEPPFSLPILAERTLCQIDDRLIPNAVIRTTLYELG
jgi:hypothetical protein